MGPYKKTLWKIKRHRTFFRPRLGETWDACATTDSVVTFVLGLGKKKGPDRWIGSLQEDTLENYTAQNIFPSAAWGDLGCLCHHGFPGKVGFGFGTKKKDPIAGLGPYKKALRKIIRHRTFFHPRIGETWDACATTDSSGKSVLGLAQKKRTRSLDWVLTRRHSGKLNGTEHFSIRGSGKLGMPVPPPNSLGK